MGRALMGTGVGTGKRRATEAAETAISSPLLEDVSIEGATGILINITGGPDLTLHELNEASTLIQHAAHEDANIIFGSVIDPNLSEEIRITVIATGFDREAKTQMLVPEPTKTPMPTPTPNTNRRLSASQIVLPYDVSSQVTKEYPAPKPPAMKAAIVDEPDIDVTWDERDGMHEVSEVERALSELSKPIPEDAVRLASGSGPSPSNGEVLVQPERKRAQSRPSMKAVLSGEIDTDNELDVPAFIRRHGAHQ